MLFFLNEVIQSNKSGIEFAQMQRLNLFNKNNKSAKIVTRRYSNLTHQVINEAGIDDEHFVNMFDYFQEACNVPTKEVTIKDLPIDSSWTRKAAGNDYIFEKDGHRVLFVRRNDGTAKTIINVQYFDHFGKLLKVQWYDNRGFISVEHLYGWGNTISTENYYTPSGKLAIQLSHMYNRSSEVVDSYRLFNYKGHNYQFAGLGEMFSFFLDQLVMDETMCSNEPVGLIVDRNLELAESVLNMKHRVPRYMQLHSNHVNNSKDVMNSTYNYNYTWGFNHLKDWDGVIALTRQQQDDVKLRLGKFGVPIYRIPSAIVSDEVRNAPRVPFEKRKLHNVVVVARLSPEKQQEHILNAWPKVLEEVPDATLDLWGYANDGYDEKLKNIVKTLNLEKSVHFKGYTTEVGKVDDEAQLMVLPSSAEGLSIALVEAESHGLPMVANDIKYGPGDIIIDGRDGILTRNGDIKGLAKTVVSLLTNQKKLAEMSTNAYEDSYRYSEPEVMKLWQQIIDDVNEKGANK